MLPMTNDDISITCPLVHLIDSIEDTLIFQFDIDPGRANAMAVAICDTIESLDTDST